MANVCVTFDNIDGVTSDDTKKRKVRPGYDHVNVHMIFYINMDGKFTRKERFMDDGHKTSPPP